MNTYHSLPCTVLTSHHAECPMLTVLPFLWERLVRGAKELLERRRV